MPNKPESPYNALKRIFHEPNRLAIMSVLCRSANGVAFRELREECNLTDGNLSRHLKALEEAQAVSIDKRFVGSKPRTTVQLTDRGRESFIEYLKALEEVLKHAADAVTAGDETVDLDFAFIKTARA